MNTRMKAALAAGALIVATGAGFGVGQAYQPHMGAALSDLQAAQSQLNQAVPDKGGHRVAALSLVGQAITQVQAGIAVGAGY